MHPCILIFILCASLQVPAQTTLPVIPAPVKMLDKPGSFTIDQQTVIVDRNGREKATVDFLNAYLQKNYGFTLQVKEKAGKNAIRFSTRAFIKAPDNPERYTLKISSAAIHVEGNGHAGTFYGLQTLLQLLPVDKSTSLTIPAVTIDDYPRFKYRGTMLDVSRHFFDTGFIKKFIDLLAFHKINTFHWHLTDDQGWRIEIKKYPRLTETGGCRNGTIIGRYPGTGNDAQPYCGYYTQEEIKEIVQYAADRFITVIPEIELPGHSSAAIAAYPQLSCFPDEPTKAVNGTSWHGDTTRKNVQQAWGVFEDVYCPSEYTFNFLQDVLNEVINLFPSKYIHIGGDECPKEAWKRSAFCQKLIKEHNLKDEQELQSYFIQRIEKYLNNKGKTMIGWDEILEGGLAPNATVMSWRGEKGGVEAAKQKHDVIMAPNAYVYLDHSQRKKEDSLTIGGYLPLLKVYSFNPVPAELTADEQRYILGAQANLWSEYIHSPSKLEYMAFPRLTALSEVMWSSLKNKNWENFKKRMSTQFKRYQLWGIQYYPALNEPLR